MLMSCQGVSDEIFMKKLSNAKKSMNAGKMIKKLYKSAENL